MAESVILEETIYEGFSGGNFAVSPAPIVLTEGETYRVVWDGVEHECVCALLDGFPTVTDADDLAAPTEASFLIQYASAEMAEADADILVLSAIDLTSDTMMDTVNTSHTVAIYQVVEEESGDSGTEEPENPEESYDANDVSVKSYSQENVIFRDVPKIWLKKAGSSDEEPVLVPFSFGEVVEGVQIQLDFSEGDQVIAVPEGQLVKEATIVRPEGLVPENIRQGAEIAGVPGEYTPETQEQEVALFMPEDDQVVLPTDGKFLSKVTIKKPDTLKPENIAKDVEIGGVVGTHEGSGADHYIFYTSDDGINVLLEKPIMHGDTAGDVIALGLMEEPSKEEENMENTFLGWSDAVGGEVKTTMFEDVTESRTVYAVFKSVAIVASGTCGAAATWKLNADGVMTISGEGAMTDFVAASDQPWVDYANDITAVVIKGGVTTIGDYAFRNCSALTSIEIPDSVTIIGKNAFYGCAFASISIPDSVTSLGAGLFWGCTALTSIIIPDCVTEVPYAAFYKCSALNSVTIPDSVTYIGQYAFNSCQALKTVVIPDSVTSIDNLAFAKSGLTSVTIGNGVITIGENAFLNCTNLTSVTIGNGVTTIGDYAFRNCSALTSIEIPDSVTSVGTYAFYECSALTSAAIGNGVTSIGAWAFASCTKLTSIEIPDSVTSLGDRAFYQCTSLSNVVIGDGITTIRMATFYSCTKLTSITIPGNVTSIETSAFNACSALTSVTFKTISGWWVSKSSTATSGTSLSSSYLANTSTAATYLRSTYVSYYWKRS